MTSTASTPSLTVLVYSSDSAVRQSVILGIGRRPSPELPRVEFVECATAPAVIARMDAGGIDLAVLDAEASPAGGLGIARQLKDEIWNCPPVLALTARAQDGWLASWSRADAVVPRPIDPRLIADAAASLLRRRVADLPA